MGWQRRGATWCRIKAAAECPKQGHHSLEAQQTNLEQGILGLIEATLRGEHGEKVDRAEPELGVREIVRAARRIDGDLIQRLEFLEMGNRRESVRAILDGG